MPYETRIAGRDRPSVSAIHVRGDTLYCRIGEADFAKDPGGAWRRASPAERPILRQPVHTPFWTWTHDLVRKTVDGTYRDAQGVERRLTWSDGEFAFDRFTDEAWFDGAVWLFTAAGVAAYPAYQGYLNIDSLRVFSPPDTADRMTVVTEGNTPATLLIRRADASDILRYDPSGRFLVVTPSGADGIRIRDRFVYRALFDDGLWRGRRRAEGDKPNLPAVTIEMRADDVWQHIGLSGGLFDFDDVLDMSIDGEHIWLATKAGICRYPLIGILDPGKLAPLWGSEFRDVTDIRRNGKETSAPTFFRRGNHNDTVRKLDPATWATSPVNSDENPFLRLPVVETPYWLWVRDEQYAGSVVSDFRLGLDILTAEGQWVPADIDSTRRFSFDRVRDLVFYDNALWAATPDGVIHYPSGERIHLEDATVHVAGGRLRDVVRLGVNRNGRLISATEDGHTYTLDLRNRWEETDDEETPTSLRFREDEWFWHEREGRVEIRFRDDPARLRTLYHSRFSDHHVAAVASDSSSLWMLTPVGLIRYARPEPKDTLRVIRRYTGSDFAGTPDSLWDTVAGIGTDRHGVRAIVRERERLWLLTSAFLLAYRVSANGTLGYEHHAPLPDAALSASEGYLSLAANGAMRVDFRAAGRGLSYRFDTDTQRFSDLYDLPPAGLILREQASILPGRNVIHTLDEDDEHLWLGTAEAIFRIRK